MLFRRNFFGFGLKLLLLGTRIRFPKRQNKPKVLVFWEFGPFLILKAQSTIIKLNCTVNNVSAVQVSSVQLNKFYLIFESYL